MEKFYIICGSLVVPCTIIIAMVVTKRMLKKRAAETRAKDIELITVLEELVQSKNEHIKRLK